MPEREESRFEKKLRAFLPFALTDARLTILAMLAAALVAVFSRTEMVGGLDAIVFNYVNNTADVRPLFYFNGWVSLYPALLAYAARNFPLSVQISLYFMTSVGVVMVLQRELQKFLQLSYRPIEAAMFSFVVLLSIRSLVAVLNLLVWSVWPAVLAAGCYILRKNVTQQRISPIGALATCLACLSNPTAVIFIPLLLFFSFKRPPTAPGRVDIILAAAIFFYYSAMALLKPAEIDYVNFHLWTATEKLIANLIAEHRLTSAAQIVAIVALIYFAVKIWVSPVRAELNGLAILGLAYLGLGSMALYFMSARFLHYGRLPNRYAIILVAVAELALFCYLAVMPRRAWRERIVVASLLIDVVLAAVLFHHGIPGTIRDDLEKYSYASAADRFRKNCQKGDALASLPQNFNLVLLCERQNFDRAMLAAAPPPDSDGFDRDFVEVPAARLWTSGAVVPARIYLLTPLW